MRYLSVCSGIEAASVAWAPLGWTAAAFAEIDPFCCALLEHHYPDVPNLGDMTELSTDGIGAVDVLVGGTPCQSFSVAGLRKGMADPRGNLALGFLAIADRVRPRWVLWENVPGVRSSGEGRDFGSFIGGLAELGYGVAWRSLDAQYFHLAQRRERVFVVGHLGDWRRAAAVFFERACLSRNPPPSREAGTGTTRSVAACLNSGGNNGGFRTKPGEHLVATALQAKDGRGVHSQMDNLMIGFHSRQDPISSPSLSLPLEAKGGQCVAFAQNQRGELRTSETAASLSLGGGKPGQGYPAVAFQTRIARNGRGQPKDITDALTSSDGGTHADSKPHVAGSFGVRRLTPRECERLQGFPDDYTLVPYRGNPAKDAPRYRALGNSMAVPVMRWIGRRIQIVEDLQ